MEIKNLDSVIESLLFVAGNGIAAEDITNLLNIDKKELDESVKRLKQKYGGECGIHLISYNKKLQFGSNPANADTIGLVLNPVRERELTNATLETVAIIAYKQPITRLEIEQIRGLSSDYAMQVLLKHDLVEVIGRKDTVGKPLLYGTTDTFLKRFQIESLDQLPDYEQLLENIKVINDQVEVKPASTSLYYDFEIPEEDVENPEFLKGEEKIEKYESN